MKKIITVLALCFVSAASFSADLQMPIRGVSDGDTIRSSVALPCPLCAVSIRILGIDTPESNYLAKCPLEKARGLEAKEFVKKLVGSNTTMMVRNIKWDKYGGRINGHVEIAGVDVGQALIDRGLARPYTGQGPKSNWCIDQ